MSDYLQDTEKMFFEELVNANIVARDGRILDKANYIKWLQQKEEDVRSQLQQIPEPGDVYDRYQANLLHKDLEVIRQMILRQTDSKNKEPQPMVEIKDSKTGKTLFMQSLEFLNRGGRK